ncbi:hypothetical protein [Methylovirgula sp. HY1]|uniref:hypothetical protein n=1 Tax=Methylovirgula sp. HY1 TaxID=2822761 RepID=UPI001C5BFB66|nr:hypothetical protein [Methylovirgula sp. HY1]QXX74264.1 hypothetical protein MHY1_01074 [Methylovirgula sp. HY1]
MPNFQQYNVEIKPIWTSHNSGRAAKYIAIIFAGLSFLAYAFTEVSWFAATSNLTEIGVGLSTYYAVGFQRAIALGVISCAFASLSVAMRQHELLRVRYRDSVADKPEHPKDTEPGFKVYSDHVKDQAIG